MTPSTSHLVILPAYNAGPRLRDVVAEVLRHWQPVLVVDDGSTDGSDAVLRELARENPAISVLSSPRNSGKGAAVLAGARAARERGFTHALVMDADGQHPAESIGGFMESSRRQPAALVLGRPIFPANIPAERLHGRKISVALVRFELFGDGVADPLFGFRVYPLGPLLAVLGSRRGGRRYDFDTEAAVRLCWAGVPPVNLAAPVRYFSRAEGGVSHFRYGRDNLTLAWMHTRLIAELLLLRWPMLLRHRREWKTAAISLAVLVWCVAHGGQAEPASREKPAPVEMPAAGGGAQDRPGSPAQARSDSDALVNPAHRLAAGAPVWKDLAEAFAHQPDTAADFTERRYYSFKKEPVELKGEVRVSATRGLSLHYLQPDERIVILDAQGILIRAGQGQTAPPADPRASATNDALLHILRFDFAALEKDFELYGQRDAGSWTLVLIPRTSAQKRSFSRITVSGEPASTAVRRIELRHSARQSIEILMAPPRPPAPFDPEELKRFFR